MSHGKTIIISTTTAKRITHYSQERNPRHIPPLEPRNNSIRHRARRYELGIAGSQAEERPEEECRHDNGENVRNVWAAGGEAHEDACEWEGEEEGGY
jgi:hypothetical protein